MIFMHNHCTIDGAYKEGGSREVTGEQGDSRGSRDNERPTHYLQELLTCDK